MDFWGHSEGEKKKKKKVNFTSANGYFMQDLCLWQCFVTGIV